MDERSAEAGKEVPDAATPEPTRLERREVRSLCWEGLKEAVAGGFAAGCQRRLAPRS
jgi:hypothetical protein